MSLQRKTLICFILLLLIGAGGFLIYGRYQASQDTASNSHLEVISELEDQKTEITDDGLQGVTDLFGEKWSIADDQAVAKIYIANNSIKKTKVDKENFTKVLIRYDYKYQDPIFGPDVKYAVFQIWLQPEEHQFRIVKRENFDGNGSLLAVRRYSIAGKWEDYRANDKWRVTLEQVVVLADEKLKSEEY